MNNCDKDFKALLEEMKQKQDAIPKNKFWTCGYVKECFAQCPLSDNHMIRLANQIRNGKLGSRTPAGKMFKQKEVSMPAEALV